MPDPLKHRLEEASGFKIPDHRWGHLRDKCLQAESFKEQLALTAVSKTQWFRDDPWFRALERDFCPLLKTQNRPWACWSAGCSTGEEAYSLTLLLERFLAPSPGDLEILGTDLIEERVRFAARGEYPAPASDSLLRSYRSSFEVSETTWRFRGQSTPPNFRRHNLVSEMFPRPSKGSWDLILCRNVLIYLTKEKQREILRQFHEVLGAHAWLVTGASETLLEHQDLFQVRFSGEAFYFQKR